MRKKEGTSSEDRVRAEERVLRSVGGKGMTREERRETEREREGRVGIEKEGDRRKNKQQQDQDMRVSECWGKTRSGLSGEE